MANGKVTSRSGGHQAVFELKQRVAIALNKVADRDTYQLGVEELDRIVKSLTPDLASPLLSCILDTDSEKKSSVRKECIRLMGTLVKFHGGLIGSYLGKMIASIVKRLKDSDSGVRDACMDTVEVLAATLSSDRIDTGGLFVALVRPLFEALGEQNKQVQCGSALCLSRVIDAFHDPPPVVLQKMLERTVKLLKNPHFMGKPAVIELNRSIVMAGGASTHTSLSSALKSILESIKSADWTIRKAACNALADIASCGAACLSSYRNSCLRCLESCRFDKVKPVRDIAMQALQLWRNLPGSNTSEPSDSGSSVKERTYRHDHGDLASSCESKLKDNTHVKSTSEVPKKKVPLCSRKPGSYGGNSQNPGANNWSVEIAVPKNLQAIVAESQNDDSECSSVTKICTDYDARRLSDTEYKYVEVDEVHECSSVFNSFPKNFKSHLISPQSDALEDSSLLISTANSQRFAVDEISIDGQRNVARIHDRRGSLDSTITESMSHTANVSFPPTDDMQTIRKQLLEIENKQSNLMDMLKAFTFSVMDSMSVVQSKVSNLETVVHKMAEELVQGGRGSVDSLAGTMLKGSPLGPSRLSTCTPRPSIDIINQQLVHPVKLAGRWEDNTSRSRSLNSLKQNSDQCGGTLKPARSFLPRGNSSFCSQIHAKMREDGRIGSVPINKARVANQRNAMSCSPLGDLEAAYIGALYSRNENTLFELLETTGPVLENLSEKTASELMIVLGSYLMEQRYVNSIIPWLEQLMDLSSIRDPTYQVISANAKRELLHSIQEASMLARSNPMESKCFTEIEEAICFDDLVMICLMSVWFTKTYASSTWTAAAGLRSYFLTIA